MSVETYIMDVCSVLLMQDMVSTYQHVLSAFVSAGVTVEMLSKPWLYMCTFVLQHTQKITKKISVCYLFISSFFNVAIR